MVHVTLHTALRNVFGQLTEEAILAKARLADQFMSRLMQPKSELRGQGPIGVQHPDGPFRQIGPDRHYAPTLRGRGSASAR